MTAPAPETGRFQTDPRVSDRATKTIQAPGEVCPEVVAVAQSIGYVQPAKLRMLQRLYDRYMENAQSDYDFGGHVLTYIRRGHSTNDGGRVSRSASVDSQVGDLVARRLAK